MHNRNLLKLMLACISLILVLVIIYSGLRFLESTVLFADQDGETAVSTKTIIRDGIEYYPRQDIKIVMVLGIDREGIAEPSTELNHGDAADMISLLIFDEATQSCTVLNLNRDTMLDMPTLDDYGRAVGFTFDQLAFSYTYGSGMEDSCENTRTAVSDFLGEKYYEFHVDEDARDDLVLRLFYAEK